MSEKDTDALKAELRELRVRLRAADQALNDARMQSDRIERVVLRGEFRTFAAAGADDPLADVKE